MTLNGAGVYISIMIGLEETSNDNGGRIGWRHRDADFVTL